MERTKKFRFNILDVIIIIVAIACVLGLALRFNLADRIAGNKETAIITVVSSNLRSGTIDNGKSLNKGDEFYCDKFNGKFGDLRDFEFSPAKYFNENIDGHMQQSYLTTPDNQGEPMRLDVIATFTMTGRFDDDGGFYADGINLIAPNATLEIYSQNRLMYVTVVSVEKSN